MTLVKILAWSLGAALVAAGLYGLHRWAVYLEDRGYIYYRTKPRGWAGGVLLEMAKWTRPSVEHVQQAMDVQDEPQEQDGQ